MSNIQINSVEVLQQPSSVLEEYIQIQTEQTSINGGMQRNKISQKKQSTLIFRDISVAAYQSLLSSFSTGSGVYYYNPLSAQPGGVFTFSGLPFFENSPYEPGASLLQPFKVRIREN